MNRRRHPAARIQPPTRARIRVDDWKVEIAVDQERGRTACVWTNGLARRGLPELYLEPSARYEGLEEVDWPTETLLFARMLVYLAEDLIAAGSLPLSERVETIDGRTVRFWAADPEVPRGALAVALPGARSAAAVRWLETS